VSDTCICSCVVVQVPEKEKDNVEASSALEVLKKMVLAAGTGQVTNQGIAITMLSQMPLLVFGSCSM